MLPVGERARRGNPAAKALCHRSRAAAIRTVRGREVSGARERLFIGVGWLRLPANWGGHDANPKDILAIGGGGGRAGCRWTRWFDRRSSGCGERRDKHKRRRAEQRGLGCSSGSRREGF